MLDFYNTKINADKTLKEQVIETFNIDVISDKNALLYSNNSDDYINVTNSPKINCGMTLYKGKYYFFEQCLTDRLPVYSYSYSYYVYPIRNELAENILKTNKINIWLIKFESLYYYGGFYKNVNIYGVHTYFFKSILEDGIMTIPYSISPLISMKKKYNNIGLFQRMV